MGPPRDDVDRKPIGSGPTHLEQNRLVIIQNACISPPFTLGGFVIAYKFIWCVKTRSS